MTNLKIESRFVVIAVLVCAFTLSLYSMYGSSHLHSVYMASSIAEKFGVKIEKDPPQSKLAHLGVESWPKYVLNQLLYIVICYNYYNYFFTKKLIHRLANPIATHDELSYTFKKIRSYGEKGELKL